MVESKPLNCRCRLRQLSGSGGCIVGVKEVSRMKRALRAAFDPKVLLAKVGKGRTPADYKKKQTLFSQGDPADAIFYIQTGKVKLTVVSKQGKEAVVAIVGVDDFFGEGCLGGQSLRMSSAAAMSECSIMRLEKPGVVRLIHVLLLMANFGKDGEGQKGFVQSFIGPGQTSRLPIYARHRKNAPTPPVDSSNVASSINVTTAPVCLAFVTNRSGRETCRGSSLSVPPFESGISGARMASTSSSWGWLASSAPLMSSSSTCPLASASSVSSNPTTANPRARYCCISRSTFSPAVLASCSWSFSRVADRTS